MYQAHPVLKDHFWWRAGGQHCSGEDPQGRAKLHSSGLPPSVKEPNLVKPRLTQLSSGATQSGQAQTSRSWTGCSWRRISRSHQSDRLGPSKESAAPRKRANEWLWAQGREIRRWISDTRTTRQGFLPTDKPQILTLPARFGDKQMLDFEVKIRYELPRWESTSHQMGKMIQHFQQKEFLLFQVQPIV